MSWLTDLARRIGPTLERIAPVVSAINPIAGTAVGALGGLATATTAKARQQAGLRGLKDLSQVAKEQGSDYVRNAADTALFVDRYSGLPLELLANYNFNNSEYERKARETRERVDRDYAIIEKDLLEKRRRASEMQKVVKQAQMDTRLLIDTMSGIPRTQRYRLEALGRGEADRVGELLQTTNDRLRSIGGY